MRRVDGPLGAAYQALRDQVPHADVTYTDDTGWRVGGVPAQLMVFVTDTATVFQIRPQHRNEEVREVIGDAYAGVLVTDRGKSYDAKELESVPQQKCLLHALRSIHAVLETKQGRARHFGTQLKALLKEGLELWHEYHDHHGQLPGFASRVRSLQAAMTRHLRPRRLVDADNQRFRDEFGRHHARSNLLRFLTDPRVKPTNNDSERGFRFAVIQRKVSQCSKTDTGARAFEAFASVIKTAMRQGEDVVAWLTRFPESFVPGQSRRLTHTSWCPSRSDRAGTFWEVYVCAVPGHQTPEVTRRDRRKSSVACTLTPRSEAAWLLPESSRRRDCAIRAAYQLQPVHLA